MHEQPNSLTPQGKANIGGTPPPESKRVGMPDVNGSPESDPWMESANPVKETPTPFGGLREVK